MLAHLQESLVEGVLLCPTPILYFFRVLDHSSLSVPVDSRSLILG